MALAISTQIPFSEWERLARNDERLIDTAWQILRDAQADAKNKHSTDDTPGPGGPQYSG